MLLSFFFPPFGEYRAEKKKWQALLNITWIVVGFEPGDACVKVAYGCIIQHWQRGTQDGESPCLFQSAEE